MFTMSLTFIKVSLKRDTLPVPTPYWANSGASVRIPGLPSNHRWVFPSEYPKSFIHSFIIHSPSLSVFTEWWVSVSLFYILVIDKEKKTGRQRWKCYHITLRKMVIIKQHIHRNTSPIILSTILLLEYPPSFSHFFSYSIWNRPDHPYQVANWKNKTTT